MTVMMTMRAPADTQAFRSFIEANSDRLAKISEDAKAKGCIHHRFAVGDGFVTVIDEWESAQAFNGFFEGNEAVAAVMREAGIQGEPDISIAESIESADQF
jgi:hypothetical protein